MNRLVILMRKLILLCLFSGIAGGLAALAWFGAPGVEPQTAAQESTPWPTQGSNAPTGDAAGVAPLPPAAANQPAPAELQKLTPDEQVNVMVYQNVNRSVVNINTRGLQTDRFSLFAVPTEGEGSGSVLDRQGRILTNFHVVEDAKQIQVTLFDGSVYDARLVGVDPITDMAVLKIDARPELLYPVIFGSSSNLLVGQRVFAIGNPFGLERTLTTGIISSLNRSLPVLHTQRLMKSIIQIDAAINPGNSGGPLLDSRGQMIGMCTAIATKTGESSGVGFAIPVNTIARVVPQLIQTGKVIRPESGIEPIFLLTDRGLRILKLVPGGPAEKAGLQGVKIERVPKRQGLLVFEQQKINVAAADIITAVDGQPVRNGNDFLDLIESKRPGDQVMLTIIRGGKLLQVPLRLAAGQ
jgi:S1-C subfamily serine protease